MDTRRSRALLFRGGSAAHSKCTSLYMHALKLQRQDMMCLFLFVTTQEIYSQEWPPTPPDSQSRPVCVTPNPSIIQNETPIGSTSTSTGQVKRRLAFSTSSEVTVNSNVFSVWSTAHLRCVNV